MTNEQGIAIVVLAISLITTIALITLAVDVGLLMRRRTSSTLAADLGALVGTSMLQNRAPRRKIRSAAKELYRANLIAMGQCSMPDDNDCLPNRAKITGKRVTVDHSLAHHYYFAGVLPGAASSSLLHMASASEYRDPLAVDPETARDVMIVIDSSYLMDNLYGASCDEYDYSQSHNCEAWDEHFELCPQPGCIPKIEGARRMAKEIISGLTADDRISLIQFGPTAHTWASWVSLNDGHGHVDPNVVSGLYDILDHDIGCNDPRFHLYSDPGAAFHIALSEAHKLIPLSPREIVVAFITGDFGNVVTRRLDAPYDPPVLDFPEGYTGYEMCMAEYLVCFEQAPEPTDPSFWDAIQICENEKALCAAGSPGLVEEAAGMFIKNMQRVRDTRVYSIAIGDIDYSEELSMPENELNTRRNYVGLMSYINYERHVLRSRAWNFLVELSGSEAEKLETTVSNLRLYSLQDVVRPRGRVFNPYPVADASSPISYAGVAKKLLEHARGSAHNPYPGSSPRLVPPLP